MASSQARSVLIARAMCSAASPCGAALWGCSLSGFHHFFATQPFCSETNKAEPSSSGDHSSIRDFPPIALSGYLHTPKPDTPPTFSATRVTGK